MGDAVRVNEFARIQLGTLTNSSPCDLVEICRINVRSTHSGRTSSARTRSMRNYSIFASNSDVRKTVIHNSAETRLSFSECRQTGALSTETARTEITSINAASFRLSFHQPSARKRYKPTTKKTVENNSSMPQDSAIVFNCGISFVNSSAYASNAQACGVNKLIF